MFTRSFLFNAKILAQLANRSSVCLICMMILRYRFAKCREVPLKDHYGNGFKLRYVDIRFFSVVPQTKAVLT